MYQDNMFTEKITTRIYKHCAVLEGDFLTAYFVSLGNLNRFLNRGNSLFNDLLANLHARIDFVPGDEGEEEMSTVATASVTGAASAGARANPRGKGNGFSVRRLLEDAVSSVVSATIRQYSRQSNETALCIREVIEVLILFSQ